MFHSLRIYKKGDDNNASNQVAKIQSTTEILSRNLDPKITPPEKFQNQKPSSQSVDFESSGFLGKSKSESIVPGEEVQSNAEVEQDIAPMVPDRKSKPKFFNGKFKWKSNGDKNSDTSDSFVNNDDNESLISGIERLSNSPAPVPAPRKLISSGSTKNSLNAKHTYQNVPIPISPNNSQDLPLDDEVSFQTDFLQKIHLNTIFRLEAQNEKFLKDSFLPVPPLSLLCPPNSTGIGINVTAREL